MSYNYTQLEGESNFSFQYEKTCRINLAPQSHLIKGPNSSSLLPTQIGMKFNTCHFPLPL